MYNGLKSMVWLKRNYFVLIILVFAFFVRILWLQNVPTSTNYDQLHYLLDAKSFFITGKDITGTVSLLDTFLFRYPAYAGMQAELPYLLELFFVGPFPFSLVAAAMPNVILGTATVYILYLIGKEFVGRRAGLIASLLAAINPWLIFSSRTVYEAVPATFFYFLTLYIFIRARGKYLLLTIPTMILAFYSYIGTKLIFLPFILLCASYSYFVLQKRKHSQIYVAIIISACFLLAAFIYQIHGQSTSRTGDVFLPSNSHVTEMVNEARKTPLQTPFSKFFENKITIYGRVLLTNTFNLTSPQYLFGTGDYFFSLQRHGLFYVLDALFLFIGIFSFFKTNHKKSIFFLSLLALSIVPQVFHDPEGSGNFTPHIALLIPLFIILIAAGIESLLQVAEKKRLLPITISALFLFYGFFLLNFLYLYFHQLPLNDNIFWFPHRVVSRYIQLAEQKNIPLQIHVGDPGMFMKEYLFYSGKYRGDSVTKINDLLNKKNFSLGSVQFTQCTAKDIGGTNIYESICAHKSSTHSDTIPHLRDSGNAFDIYSDILCKEYPKDRFVTQLSVSDLSVENLDTPEFCKKYVISY